MVEDLSTYADGRTIALPKIGETSYRTNVARTEPLTVAPGRKRTATAVATVSGDHTTRASTITKVTERTTSTTVDGVLAQGVATDETVTDTRDTVAIRRIELERPTSTTGERTIGDTRAMTNVVRHLTSTMEKRGSRTLLRIVIDLGTNHS